MGWTERQRRMLEEMGLKVWVPEGEGSELVALPEAEAGVAPEAPAGPVVPLVPAEAPVRVSAGSAVAEMDWTALREAVANCRACRLCEGRRNTVFGVGNERAHLMVVGEAPGEQEDRKGEPFVGPAGHLLDSMLRALGLTREAAEPARQVFIANTLKCRPPGNRNPEPDEMVKCEPFLKRQLALVQPRVILAMGRFAVQALLRSSEPIGRLRGRVHTYEGVPLVVTYHPAYLLRNLPDKAKAWDDLCLAATLLEKGA
jgi:uracil-DNA glycosylase family 4